MTPRGKRILWATLASGAIARLIFAFATHGSTFDIESFRVVAEQLAAAPLELYAAVNVGEAYRWPYPPLYFPWVLGADALADATGLAFHGVIGLPAIAADSAIAWVVQNHLGRRGQSERTRLAAAALVALGPTFVTVSGYHGQLDPVAILPAVVAVVLWDRMPVGRRALASGLLIGVGAAVKTVPILALLALLPTCRSRREAVTLVGVAGAVVLASLAPWLLHDPHGVAGALGYSGAPGAGGLSLVVRPAAAARWLTHFVELGGAQTLIYENRTLINAAVVGGLAAFLIRHRTPAVPAAVIVWLAIWIFGPGFFFQYLVWGIPFLLLAGHLRAAAGIQAVALVPLYLFYQGPWGTEAVVPVYAALMILLWIGWLVGLVVLGRREVRDAHAAERVWDVRLPDLPPAPKSVGARAMLREPALIAIFLALAALSTLVLVAVLVDAGRGMFAGADGPFAADQLQYLAWVRDAGTHILVDNDFDLAPSGQVFLHPMWLLSGLAWSVLGGIELWVVAWKPVAVVALFAGFAVYVRRFIGGRGLQAAALLLALFFASPATPLADWLGVSAARVDDLVVVGGEAASGLALWGYLPTAITLGLMPLFLLGVERLANGSGPRRRTLVLTAAAGLLASWLHPWQGETLLVILVAAGVWGGALASLRALWVPAAAVVAPLAYYFLLSQTDPAWEIAQRQNETGHLGKAAVVAGLLPIALPALMGVRRPLGWGERMLLIWPTAALAVYLVLSPSVPAHAFEGMSLPLAILAVRGVASLRLPRVVIPVMVAVLTLPGLAWYADYCIDLVRARPQPFVLEPGERAALETIERSPRRGGVLTSGYLGSAVPAHTGRKVWVGHPSWTPSYLRRVRQAEELLSGRLDAREAGRLVRATGASFVVSDCRGRADLRPLLGDQIRTVRSFECARVYELETRGVAPR